MKVTIWSLVLTLATIASSQAAGYRADVIFQSAGHYALVAVDRYDRLSPSHTTQPQPDGYVETTYTIGTVSRQPAVNKVITGAHVEPLPHGLMVIDQAGRAIYSFWITDAASTTVRPTVPQFAEVAVEDSYQIAEHDRSSDDLLLSSVFANAPRRANGRVTALDEFDDPLYPDWWDAINGGGGGERPSCNSGGLGAISCETSLELGFKTSCKVECSPGFYACCNNATNSCKCYSNSNPPK